MYVHNERVGTIRTESVHRFSDNHSINFNFLYQQVYISALREYPYRNMLMQGVFPMVLKVNFVTKYSDWEYKKCFIFSQNCQCSIQQGPRWFT